MENSPRVRTRLGSTDAGRRCFEVWLSGEVDLDWRDDLDQMVRSFAASDATDVLINGQEVTFLASVGVGAFWRLHQIAAGRGGALTVTHTHDFVRQTLELAGLDAAITIA